MVRLGNRFKFNMMITILLCMVFVVNVGTTLANIDYGFVASSINNGITIDETTTLYQDSFVHFASASSASGKFTYSPGVQNNQLNINYGFSQSYDLMLRFKATYANKGELMGALESHKANDFSLNFANRDKWCVDMGTSTDITAGDPNPTYFTTTSTSNILTGVMYYMDILKGSGTLPVISGVTFHTSYNNSYKYIGDTLTIELEPVFVKADVSNYGTSHKFYSTTADKNGFVANATAFNNWSNYMSQKGETTYATTTAVMIYNAYAGGERALAYPADASVLNADGKVNTDLITQPTYVNTAYRYQINTVINGDTQTTTRTYNAITAGNKYYGGLGVYVIPSSNLKTISITVPYFWQNAGTTTSNVVTFEYSSDIKTLTVGGDARHYYREEITKPTYINVLDYIMFTAEKSYDYIKNNYTLILNNIDVDLILDTETIPTDDDGTTKWTNNVRPNYEIHNTTATSPILARVTDVYSGSKTYDTNLSITNKSNSVMTINSVTINSSLWYADYVSSDDGDAQEFKKTAMGDGYLPSDGLIFDTNLWSMEYSGGVFTLTRKGGYNYIPSGYTVDVITGVKIPKTTACQDATTKSANDFWCSLEVDIDEGVTIGTPIYTGSSTTGVEVITEGYYSEINSTTSGKIYIKNNTRQIITGVSLTNLVVNELNGTSGFLPRDDRSANAVEYTLTEKLTGTISIKPNEMVLAYEILPTTSSVISSFDLSVNLNSQQELQDMDLVYNQNLQKGFIINNSANSYEFRLVSTTDISDKLLNASAFIERDVEGVYYYYYKGIVCPNRVIQIFTDFATSVEVDNLVHNETSGHSYYVASNYTQWNLDDVADKEWFDAMKKLHQSPSQEDRESATIV